MARRFRYYHLPAEAAASAGHELLIRFEAGDYERYESLVDGQWVPDNAAYEAVHEHPQVREVDRDAAHRLASEQYGRERADALVR